MKRKRTYEQKLHKRLGAHESFLLERLRKEWEMMERSPARKDMRDMTTYAASAVGVALLAIAALGGIVVIAAVAPNILAGISRIGGHRRFFSRHAVRREISYLKRRGYIRTRAGDEDNEDTVAELSLTVLGKRKVIAQAFGDLAIAPQDAWDGKWRMVIFDIPDRHKWAREGLREKLKRMGFYRLQESVFVFPYLCEEEMIFLTDLYGIDRYVRLIETDAISSERDLLEAFALRRT